MYPELIISTGRKNNGTSEIYLKKSDVLNKLDVIKDKGKKLYEISGIG